MNVYCSFGLIFCYHVMSESSFTSPVLISSVTQWCSSPALPYPIKPLNKDEFFWQFNYNLFSVCYCRGRVHITLWRGGFCVDWQLIVMLFNSAFIDWLCSCQGKNNVCTGRLAVSLGGCSLFWCWFVFLCYVWPATKVNMLLVTCWHIQLLSLKYWWLCADFTCSASAATENIQYTF